MVGDVLSSGGDYALDIQTPVEKVFGPPKYVKNTFSGRGCFQKRGQLDGIFWTYLDQLMVNWWFWVGGFGFMR